MDGRASEFVFYFGSLSGTNFWKVDFKSEEGFRGGKEVELMYMHPGEKFIPHEFLNMQ